MQMEDKKKTISQREQELFITTWKLRDASFEVTKNGGNYELSRKIQKEEKETYKRQQFFKKFIKEMEKENGRKNGNI